MVRQSRYLDGALHAVDFYFYSQATWTVVVANPTLLVAPLLVFGLVVGLGVGLTLQMAKVEERGAKVRDRRVSLRCSPFVTLAV